MADVRPELIFIAGPAAGRRLVLTSNVMIAGRSPGADIHLVERHASRQQVRFELTPDGWVIENLSPNGTWVNNKRYRSRKKRILLATGDVLGVGLETRILFVSAGDDPDQALEAYHTQHPQPEGRLEPVAGESEQAELAWKAAAAPSEPPRTERAATERLPLSPEQGARKAKTRKYAIFGIIWLAFLVGLVILLSTLSKQETRPAEQVPKLSQREIADALSKVPRRNPIPMRATAELRTARSLYENLPSKAGDLYKCVKSFHLYLAYKRTAGFDDGQDEKNYQRALGQLIAEVWRKYNNAWAYEQAGDWPRAEKSFRQLTRIGREEQRGNAVYGTQRQTHFLQLQ